MKRTLGEIIKDYRLKNKLSLRDFAQKCGVSHTYIDKLEKGIDSRNGKPVEPTLLVIEKISKAMDKRTETLLEEIGFIKGECIEEKNNFIDDSDLGLWFKNIQEASPEKQEELKRFWEFITLNEKK
ncbi:helix-turn-helix transcriptional regulator [Bacillus cereus]|uniref:helix-turn-helix domain-containing protein n=1 Tax=Bacillus TaxID=1386 RepID=UPI000A372D2F|nr:MULTISPECIES: helix-turn-helix transcriptional regulator [Bacillus]MEB8736526.1 helix-turn-helix transcriptional regulator [Bacillus cereus]MDM5036146.1 helix-turn-helix transcriptional regulator [Bacillus sp. OR-18]MEB8905353.1 helix-turn-helix transcriptional regulator [Bacillus cereus]MEB9922972.1 helix-turn-helix transcriptional regulator [Bacillus cereus]MEB9986144.1 helix-turn-helix transcriptional regulator [Bacillus cereus]